MTKFVRMGQEDPMSTLCRMVIDTKYQDLPAKVVNHAKRCILDTLAITIAGSAMDGIPAIVDLVKERGGKPESIIPFYGGKVPASEAGLAIGPMSRATDLGDVHLEATHSSEYTFPTLLAATGLKDKVSGREFITAYVVGQEVLIRIGIAFKVLSIGTPLFGRSAGHFIFGCVVAVAKLLGLSLDELANAEGIAAGMTQPHDMGMYTEGTLMARVHHGFISQDAINACLLAQRGITGPRQKVLLGPQGYLGFAKWETEPDAITRGLGKEWEMLDVVMKRYSSCGGTHTSVDAILDQMREHKFEAEDIAGIDIDVTPTNRFILCTPEEIKWNPQTVPECQFSLPYIVATAAYDKDVFLSSYTPQARARKEVRELMTKISAREDPSLPVVPASRVHTTLKDGRRFSKEYLYVKGHPKNPFTEQELIDKFKKCVPYSAYKLNDAVVDSLIKACLNLEEIDDVVSALLLPLTPE